jgi:hypothetical protein
MMPKTLTAMGLDDIRESLQVKDMGGKLTKPRIYLITDEDGDDYNEPKVEKNGQNEIEHGHLCGAKYNRVCYGIEPQETEDIPAGEFKLRIFSTVN